MKKIISRSSPVIAGAFLAACGSGYQDRSVSSLPAPPDITASQRLELSEEPVYHAEIARRNSEVPSPLQVSMAGAGLTESPGFSEDCRNFDDRYDDDAQFSYYFNNGSRRVDLNFDGLSDANIDGVRVRFRFAINNDLSLSSEPLKSYKRHMNCYGSNFAGHAGSIYGEWNNFYAPNGAMAIYDREVGSRLKALGLE